MVVYKYIPVVLLSVMFLSACAKNHMVEGETRPNIVLIMTDDQGWGDLSIHGNENVRTPNIDSLAYEGASFTNFYVSPVCSPTRAELLTGRYHPRSGVYGTSAGGERMNIDETTIAELFKRSGYTTGIFGKWHNGMQYPYHPNGRGFDQFYGFASGHWGDYFSPLFLEHNGELVQGEGYIIDDFTDRAISFIENHKDEPFFVYIPFNTPHSPMQVPEKWWQRVEDRNIEMRHRDPALEDTTFTTAALAMVENIDWNVGRINQKLEELGLEDNTIVLYLSDNGPNSWRWNGGMKGRKGSIHEGGVRSPLFVKWPEKIEAGLEIDQISSVIDLLPTLADLTEIPANTNQPLDGISLKSLLLQEDEIWEDRLIYHHWNGRTSVRSQRWRFDYEGKLYDISRDRAQMEDVSDQYTEVADSLSNALDRWEEEVVEPMLMDQEDERPFPVGHPHVMNTQLPARDAIPHGSIERSNRFPNDSFFRNWSSTSDSITWNVEVLENGQFDVELYYTLKEKDTGTVLELSFKGDKLTDTLEVAHEMPLRGMENDRVQRQESYVKDFRAHDMGRVELQAGRGLLRIKALKLPGGDGPELRMVMLKRVN